MNNSKPDFDESLLSAYLDDELSSNERSQVESEVAASPKLQKLLNELRQVRAILSNAELANRDEFTSRRSSSRIVTSGPWLTGDSPNSNANSLARTGENGLVRDRTQDKVVLNDVDSLKRRVNSRNRIWYGALASTAATLLILAGLTFLNLDSGLPRIAKNTSSPPQQTIENEQAVGPHKTNDTSADTDPFATVANDQSDSMSATESMAGPMRGSGSGNAANSPTSSGRTESLPISDMRMASPTASFSASPALSGSVNQNNGLPAGVTGSTPVLASELPTPERVASPVAPSAAPPESMAQPVSGIAIDDKPSLDAFSEAATPNQRARADRRAMSRMQPRKEMQTHPRTETLGQMLVDYGMPQNLVRRMKIDKTTLFMEGEAETASKIKNNLAGSEQALIQEPTFNVQYDSNTSQNSDESTVGTTSLFDAEFSLSNIELTENFSLQWQIPASQWEQVLSELQMSLIASSATESVGALLVTPPMNELLGQATVELTLNSDTEERILRPSSTSHNNASPNTEELGEKDFQSFRTLLIKCRNVRPKSTSNE